MSGIEQYLQVQILRPTECREFTKPWPAAYPLPVGTNIGFLDEDRRINGVVNYHSIPSVNVQVLFNVIDVTEVDETNDEEVEELTQWLLKNGWCRLR